VEALVSKLQVLVNNGPALLKGTAVTIELGLTFFVVGYAMALFIAMGIVYGNKAISTLLSGFSWVFRSLPAIILLFIFFYGPTRLGINLSAFWASVFALGLRTAGYQAQYFRGGIQSIRSGQLEAARSVGMSLPKALYKIILPQMFRFALPATANEYAITIKDTSLAYAIGVVEVLQQGSFIIAREYNPLAIYVTVALIYWIITRVGTRFFAYLEKRYRIPGFKVSGFKV